MAVEIDESGRRSVSAEVEVPAALEQAWRAVATPEGVSSWFVPTTAELGDDGAPVRLICNFGPGMDSVSTVTSWDPPHRLVAESKDLGDAASLNDGGTHEGGCAVLARRHRYEGRGEMNPATHRSPVVTGAHRPRFEPARCTASLIMCCIVAAGGCGANPTGSGGGDFSAVMRANIDGAAWSADAALLGSAVNQVSPGRFSITGARLGDFAISFTLFNITGPGTYPLGVGSTGAGGTAIVANDTGSWSTPFTGEAGTIVITELTEQRITGTFAFVADPSSGQGGDAVRVTDGEFDLAVNGEAVPDPGSEPSGSSITATIGGESFTAAAVSTSQDANFQLLVIVGVSGERTFNITLGQVDTARTYEFDAAVPVNVLQVRGAQADASVCCWATNYGGSGELVVTTLTDTRIAGTFTATLGPSPGGTATGELTVEGELDVELSQ